VHSYSPWTFAGPHPTVTNFTYKDAQSAVTTMDGLKQWAGKHGGVPVVHDEFGCTVQQPNRPARLHYYKAYATAAESSGVGWAVWDDNGDFRILVRANRTWDTGVFGAIIVGK